MPTFFYFYTLSSALFSSDALLFALQGAVKYQHPFTWLVMLVNLKIPTLTLPAIQVREVQVRF